MQRNMDLIRQVLLSAEAGPPFPKIEGFTEDAIKYHKMLAIQANLIDGIVQKNNTRPTEIPAAVIVKDVTWEGHNFLSAIREDNNWEKLKKFLVDGGKAITVETLIAGAKLLFGFAP